MFEYTALAVSGQVMEVGDGLSDRLRDELQPLRVAVHAEGRPAVQISRQFGVFQVAMAGNDSSVRAVDDHT